MKLEAGKVAVVTGRGERDRVRAGGTVRDRGDARGARRRRRVGSRVAAAERIGARGVETLTVRTDVSDEASVQALAAAAIERFGTVHVVCNNAGVMSSADPWFGPLSAWTWVLGVNLWGVIHGVRAFLPVLAAQGEGSHREHREHRRALLPGFGAAYDATKHAVVAITDDLYTSMQQVGTADRRERAVPGLGAHQHPRRRAQLAGRPRRRTARRARRRRRARSRARVIDEGMPPAAVADLVADAVEADRFWVLPHPEFVEVAVQRWHDIAEGINPRIDVEVPGMPSTAQIAEEILTKLAPPAAMTR